MNIVSLLIQLKVFDPDGTLSLSNTLFMVLIAKLALQPFDWTVIAPLLLVLANHNLKKMHVQKSRSLDANQSKDIADLQAQVKSLTTAVSMKNLSR